jgi:hypothetical protein
LPLDSFLPETLNPSSVKSPSTLITTANLIPQEMPSFSNLFYALSGIVIIGALVIYVFGIPPEMKRKLERQALKTMGENKTSYVIKGSSSIFETLIRTDTE